MPGQQASGRHNEQPKAQMFVPEHPGDIIPKAMLHNALRSE